MKGDSLITSVEKLIKGSNASIYKVLRRCDFVHVQRGLSIGSRLLVRSDLCAWKANSNVGIHQFGGEAVRVSLPSELVR